MPLYHSDPKLKPIASLVFFFFLAFRAVASFYFEFLLARCLWLAVVVILV